MFARIFKIIKTLLVIVLLAYSITLAGQNYYNENFDAAGSWATTNPAAYLPTTYANPSDPAGDQFSSNEALREGTTVRSAPYAWRVKNTDNRYFRYECGETVMAFEVYMARWDNSPTPVVHIRYSINSGASYTNIDTIDGSYFTADLTYKLYSYSFITPISPIEPGQKVFIEFLTVTGERMFYDDFQAAYTASGIDNPTNFNAVTASQTQINLNWAQNGSGDNVMIVTNSVNSFGTPSGSYAVNAPFPGGGTVIYNGPGTFYEHVGLTAGNVYFYKAWSVNGTSYSTGITDSAYTQSLEPTSHPENLVAVSNGPVFINVSWTDSDAAHYLVKGSTYGYGGIVAPVDGTAEPDAQLVKNVNAGIQGHQFTGLTPNTQHYFRIYPYNGAGDATDYFTDGTVPEATASTTGLDIDLIISEIADPEENNMRFIELRNTGNTAIDFSYDPVFFCRQSNGSPASWGSVQLTGTLPAGETYVIAYSAAYFDTAYGQTADIYSGFANNNGNDGLYLYYGGNQDNGYLFDAYGQIDVDGSGTGWEYTDAQAVRKRGISAPNDTWTAAEWVIIGSKTYGNMTPGMHAASINWQGTASSDWNDRGTNWSGVHGFVPDASCVVIIPDRSNDPAIHEPSACHEIQLQSGASLTISPTGSLIIVGP